MFWLWTTLATAGAQLSGYAGLEDQIGNPYLQNQGLSVGISIGSDRTRWLRGAGELSIFPDLGTSQWRPALQRLIDDNEPTPDASKLRARQRLLVELAPLRSSADLLETALWLGVGAERLETRDDLELSQHEDSPVWQANEREAHLAPVGRTAAEVYHRQIGLRVHYSHAWFRERFGDQRPVPTQSQALGLSILFLFSRAAPEDDTPPSG